MIIEDQVRMIRRGSILIPLFIAGLIWLICIPNRIQGQTSQLIEITKEPISRLADDMTSRNISIYGVTIGMTWDEARSLLGRQNIQYLFSKTIPITVYIPPTRSTFYFTLNPSTYEIIEIGIMGRADIHPKNRYLEDRLHWRLTTARTYFFGSEGERIVNEEGISYRYLKQGFVLKYLSNGEFRFVLVAPWIQSPPVAVPPPPPPPLPLPYKCSVPFFVTGYYYPNTTLNYRWLVERIKAGELKEAKYLDFKDEDYEKLAREVDAEMEKIYQYISSVLEDYVRSGNHTKLVMKLTVFGYVDPRKLSRGLYVDETVSTDSMTIVNGAVMEGEEGNRILANLRAYYTMRQIDSYVAEKSKVYSDLKTAGRIRLHAAGKGIPIEEHDLKEMRKIELKITFSREYSAQ